MGESAADRRIGIALCVVAASGWGAMPVLALLAYAAGAPLLTVLAFRFAIATVVVWAVWAHREAIAFDRDDLRSAFVLGGLAALQALLFFLALSRIGAALATLLLNICPALVILVAWLLGRERIDGMRLAALGLTAAGVALVVAGGGGFGPIDPLGVIWATSGAVVYTAYILVSDVVIRRRRSSLRLSAFVSLGAAAALVPAAVVAGELSFALDRSGWLWIACLGVISTALPMLTLFAGISRIGPSRASLIQTLEPAVAVVLAFIFLGETLSLAQTVGASLVLGSLLLIGRRATEPVPVPGSPG